MKKFKKNLVKILLSVIVVQFFGSITLAAEHNPHKLYIGWATQNITPDGPVALAGQFNVRISKEHMDSVTCTAIAIETRDGRKSVETAIMVSCDVCVIRGRLNEEVKKRLKLQLPELDINKFWLNATHTHAGPVLREGNYEIPEGVITPTEYVNFAADRIVKAAVEAWNSRKPAGMSWGLGQAVVGHNRRAVYFEPVSSGFGKGTGVMYGKTNRADFSNIEGYEDHGVEMMFFWDKRKKLTGMLLNIACPSQETESISQLSADYWNDVRAELHKRYGDDVYIFAQCAPAGDISPHLLWRKEAEMEMLRRKGITRCQEIGARIADAVDDVYPYVQNDIKTEVVFSHFADEIDLPVRKVTKEEMEQSVELARQQPDRAKWHMRIVDRYNKQKANPYYKARVHVVRLGDVALASNPFELFLDFGLRIKTQSKAMMTVLVQLADGTGTYLPTKKAEEGGGYSAIVQSNSVGSEGGQVLVERTTEEINKMWD
jgi:hypothetical protein